MASFKPSTDRPRQPQKSRFWPRVFSTLSITSVTLAPVAALSLWLLISDPVTAAALGTAWLLALIASGLGLALGNWMSKVRR